MRPKEIENRLNTILRLYRVNADLKLDREYLVLEMNREIENIEMEIRDKVANAKDPATGKPLYTNEEQRRIAFFKECQADNKLTEKHGLLQDYMKTIEKQKFEIDMLSKEIKIIELQLKAYEVCQDEHEGDTK